MRRITPGLGWTLAALTAGGVHALTYQRYVTDDAFIAYRYAQRLISGHGLTWTDGPPVEGYTDLLWVLLHAAGLLAHIDPVTISRALGLAGFALAIVAVSLDDDLQLDPDRAASGGLLLAASGGMAVWAMGGLEHGLMAGLVAAVLVGARRGAWAIVGALLTALALLRADAAVLWVGVLAGVFATERRISPWLLVPGLAIVSQEAFRLVYYGDWLPNSARVKVAPTALRTWRGIGWTLKGLAANGVLTGLAAWGASRSGAQARLPLVLAGLWCTYVGLIGGDIFAGWRQLIPVFPALALVAADAAGGLSRRLWPLLAVLSLVPQWLDGSANLARTRAFVFDVPPMAEVLRIGWGHLDPLIAVDAAGALPYYTSFDALDMLGLNDAWLARNPPSEFGGRNIGHDLGNADYVWDREPDVIVFTGPFGGTPPPFPGGQALVARPDFETRYALVRVGAGSPSDPTIGSYFIRRDGVLGPDVLPKTVEVPSWMFATNGAVASLGPQGVMGVGIGGPNPAILDRLSLPPGRWLLDAHPEGLRIDVRINGRSLDRLGPATEVVVELPQAATLEVLIWAAEERSSRLRSFAARRTDAPPTHAPAVDTQPARMPPRQLGRITGTLGGPLVATVDARGLELPLKVTSGHVLRLAASGDTDWRVQWRSGGHLVAEEGHSSAGVSVMEPLDLKVPTGQFDSVRLIPTRAGQWTLGRR